MLIKIKVTPKSSKNEIIGIKDGLLKIKVTLPPVEGATNEAVIKLLSKELGLKKSINVQVSGISSQPEMKTFVVELCKVQKTDSQLLNADYLGLVFIAGLEKKLTSDG